MKSDISPKITKALLHVHWEGSVRLETLRNIAQRKGIAQPDDQTYKFADFGEFNAIFPRVFNPLTEEEDFFELTFDFLAQLSQEKIQYCEAFFVPLAHVRRGVPFECFFPPIIDALEQGEKRWGVHVNLIYSILRFGGNTEWGEQTLDLFEHSPHPRIVGIDLSGPESFETIAPFTSVFQRAKSLGLHRTAHAGEFCGADHVRQTINLLDVQRIGHGIGIHSDKKLIEEIIAKDIPLEICPSSNRQLGAVQSWKEHPVRELFDRGVPLIICTDDPAFFNNSLDQEYEILRSEFNFEEQEIEQLKRNAWDYCFQPSPIYCAPHKKWTKGLPERSDESPETARVEFDAPVQFFRGEQ